MKMTNGFEIKYDYKKHCFVVLKTKFLIFKVEVFSSDSFDFCVKFVKDGGF